MSHCRLMRPRPPQPPDEPTPPEAERPIIHVLIVLLAQHTGRPLFFRLVDLREWPRWQACGFTFVAIDPQDECDFYAWRDGC